MWTNARWGLMTAALLMMGCDPDVQQLGSDSPRVLVLTQIDLAAHCARARVESVEIRARPVTCEGECELLESEATVLGDRFVCPNAGSLWVFAVELDQPGAYFVDIVETYTADLPRSYCLAEDGDLVLDVTEDDLDARAQIELSETSRPCEP